ncbi:MAG: J domain-containing protein, partial [Terracidiphilus sp.]
MAFETYYSLLETSEGASAAEIKAAYLRLIREVHPDRLANAPAYWQRQAEERTKEINEAYRILSDCERRRTYDAQLAAQRRSSETRGKQTAAPRPQYKSGAGTSSTQTPRPASEQDKAPRNPTTTPKEPSQFWSRPSAPRLEAGQRLFFTFIGCLFAFGATRAFWEGSSIGDDILPSILAATFLFGIACLYRRQIQRAFLALRIARPRQQLWATVGAILIVLLAGKIASMEGQSTTIGNQPAGPIGGPDTRSAPGSTGTNPQEVPTSATESAAPYSLANGTELRRRVNMIGRGEFTVQNGSTEDAVVIVVGAANSRPIRSFYVCAGMDFTEKRIPPGNYQVYFFSGSDWNPSLRTFNRDVSYMQFGKTLEYSETTHQEGDHIQYFYDKLEITLQPVPGGNVSSSPAYKATVEQFLDQP